MTDHNLFSLHANLSLLDGRDPVLPHFSWGTQSAEYGRWSSVPSGHAQPSVRPEQWSGSESKSWFGQDWDVHAGRQAWYCSMSGHAKAAGQKKHTKSQIFTVKRKKNNFSKFSNTVDQLDFKMVDFTELDVKIIIIILQQKSYGSNLDSSTRCRCWIYGTMPHKQPELHTDCWHIQSLAPKLHKTSWGAPGNTETVFSKWLT